MNEEKDLAINTLRAEIFLKHPIHFPRGIKGTFDAKIADGLVFWNFRNEIGTRFLVKEMNKNPKPGEFIRYVQERGFAITEYPGLNKDEILEKLKSDLERFKR